MGLALDPPVLPEIVSTAGMEASAVLGLMASGEYRKVRRGALTADVAGHDEWQTRRHEALARIVAVDHKLTNGAVMSHSSAAILHGLWLYRVPSVVHVIQAAKPNGRGAPDIHRHSTALDEEHVTTVGGIRATTIERTIVDCARTMHPRDALVVADAGMRALIRPDRRRKPQYAEAIEQLRSRLMTMVGHGPGHGRRRARAVLRASDPYAESPPESVLRWIAVSRGLPAPVVQLPVRTRGGVFYVDLGWRWHRKLEDGSWQVLRTVLCEYDGELKYRAGGGLVSSAAEASDAVVAEKLREDLIREDPTVRMPRFTRAELNDPDAVVEQLLAVMPPEARRSLRPIPELLVGPRRPLY